VSAVVSEPVGPLTAPPREGLERLHVSDALTAARMELDLLAVTALDAAGVAALLDARRVLDAQTGGTPALRAPGIMCRAPEDAGTIAAPALWTGRGM